jgi:adenylate cyclase
MAPDQFDWLRFASETPVGGPTPPSKHTLTYQTQCLDRLCKRRAQMELRVDASTQGRVIPEEEQLAIGEAKHFTRMSVLFLDICGFSNIPNWTTEEQKQVLKTLNLFMGEMLTIVRDFDGTFEKNTGDGLMAYFGEGAATDAEAVKPAVEAAIMMHYVNDTWIRLMMDKDGRLPINFRVGIDVGPITIARVAIHGGSHGGIVAVGTAANVACKLMKQIPNGGICIGEKTYHALPNGLAQSCQRIDQSTGFIYIETKAAYPAWTLNYRAPYIPSV